MTGVRPLVVAHRGASDEAPEHTLAAYMRAIEAGADALEADVRLTSDGHLVCVHDRTVDRTSNGRGALSTLELAELQALDFGSWRSEAFEAPDRIGADDIQVLTLDRLLQLVVDSPRPIQLMVETKHPTRYAGLVERTLVTTLRRFGLAGPPADGQRSLVTVMSFSEIALRRVRRLAPDVPLTLLMLRLPVSYRWGTLPQGVGIAGPSLDFALAQPKYVRRLKEAGNRVFVWTVNDVADAEVLLELGVDALITDVPGKLRQLVDSLCLSTR